MPDPAVVGNLEVYLPQQLQQQTAQATMQQEQAAKQQEQATPQQGHDRMNQSLQQSNVTELATTASPGPSGLLCLNNTMCSTRESQTISSISFGSKGGKLFTLPITHYTTNSHRLN